MRDCLDSSLNRVQSVFREFLLNPQNRFNDYLDHSLQVYENRLVSLSQETLLGF